ncbi:MAG: uroporphyrinogen-III synthase [Acidobacteria bacterium]|nr:uroporphyrinogen-III synthase [Acidobacteriota bacterium]
MDVLLLRSGAHGEEIAGVTQLATHEIAGLAEGIAELRAAIAEPGAHLVVSAEAAAGFLGRIGPLPPFASVHAAGTGTAEALRALGLEVRVPESPGAAGILASLPAVLTGATVLWPRAADADEAPLLELARRGARVLAPVIYEKRRVPISPELLRRISEGAFPSIAVSALSALDALLTALETAGLSVPPVRWGAIGPETARGFAPRGLPTPSVPREARLSALVDLFATVKKEP